MKISVLLMNEAKQIMLTPENDHEIAALKLIAPGDTIEAVTKWGYYGADKSNYGVSISKTKGGWYRENIDEESLMFIITSPKEEKI